MRAKAQLRRERHMKLNSDHVVLVDLRNNKKRKNEDGAISEEQGAQRSWDPSTEQRFRKIATKGGTQIVKLC